jgi:hypothetical protein
MRSLAHFTGVVGNETDDLCGNQLDGGDVAANRNPDRVFPLIEKVSRNGTDGAEQTRRKFSSKPIVTDEICGVKVGGG